MRDAYHDIIDRIIGRTTIAAEALVDSIRTEIVNELGLLWETNTNLDAITQTVIAILERTQPLLIDHLSSTDIMGWVAGIDQVYKQFPGWLADEFKTGIRSLPPSPPKPPGGFRLFGMFGDAPKIRFPIIEEAAQALFDANVMTRAEWDTQTEDARARAFFITGDLTTDTIAAVRDTLVNDIREGTSLRGFREKLGDTLQGASIGPARIETIYRTNVQSAFRDGRETLASNPIVQSVFPYQAYLAVRDARARSTHREMETLGLDGTNVYRRDDPIWDLWTPPNGYNCRCGVRLMTVEAAARAGVKEAQVWLASGRPPEVPEWRVNFINIQPDPGFAGRGRMGVLV